MNKTEFTSREPDFSNTVYIDKSQITDDTLKDFSSRKTLVEKTISDMLQKNNFTVQIDLEGVNVEKEKLERLIIELEPRLKELGARLYILNNSILSDEFLHG